MSSQKYLSFIYVLALKADSALSYSIKVFQVRDLSNISIYIKVNRNIYTLYIVPKGLKTLKYLSCPKVLFALFVITTKITFVRGGSEFLSI